MPAERSSGVNGEVPPARRRSKAMTEERRNIAESVKDGIIGTIRGTGEIVNAAVDTVSGVLVKAIRETGAVTAATTGAVSDAVRGAILGAS